MIFTSSARNNVSSADLSSELQQLGLPREHSTVISRLHSENCAQLAAILTNQSLRCKLEFINIKFNFDTCILITFLYLFSE
jgi:hypothetical protein